MKKILFLTFVAVIFSFTACNKDVPEEPPAPDQTKPLTEFEIMYNKATSEFKYPEENPTFTITAKGELDRIYADMENKKIYVLSTVDSDTTDDKPVYSLTGTINCQIINLTKGTELSLEGVDISFENGPVIYGEKKISLKPKNGTVNTLTSTGESADKAAAVYCEKAIEIGAKGTLTINSPFKNGIKGGDIKFNNKAFTLNINYTGTGKNDGSAISCETFRNDADIDKAFTAILKNFKNGIKADKNFTMTQGIFDMTEIDFAPIKTDSKNDPEKYFINITGGTIKLETEDQYEKIASDKTEIADGVIKYPN